MKQLNKNNIFIDTNILIGAYSDDKNFDKEKRCWKYLSSIKGKNVYVSSLSIAQFVSIFQHKKNNDKIKKDVKNILAKVDIIEFTKEDIEKSLKLKQHDLEDNIQYVLAEKLKCKIFVTQNKKDYSSYLNTTVITASEYKAIN